MGWYQIFQSGPEYEQRKQKLGAGTFVPPNISLKDLYAAVPRHLFKRSTSKSLFYILQHLAITYAFYSMGCKIDYFVEIVMARIVPVLGLGELAVAFFGKIISSAMWLLYWGWQGMAFAGIWCLGHEAGHDGLSEYRWFNHISGILLHTFVLTPFYAWRATHRTHHKATNNMERDETYMPPTRKDFNLPDGKVAVRMDYQEVLEETPAFTLFKLFMRQFFGFQLYLLHNRKGNRRYPPYTSHYLPSSQLFKPEERKNIIVSNIAILSMLSLLGLYARINGGKALVVHYLMPWLFQHNWMVMFTYLQHSDPTIPYYRSKEWTFSRGALATVDRPLFGWVGRVLLHNISTDHLAHHFFASVPFYNLPEVTEAIKPVLGEYYNYDSTGVIYALWRSFTQCVFVEDEGEVLFFKNWYGEALLTTADKDHVQDSK